MLTLPNLLTLSRIVAVPLLAALLWWPDWRLGYGLGFAMYTLMGLTDYFDDRAMSLLHRLMRECLNPGGSLLVANFTPGHIGMGWMDAVMDWHLVYRTEADLERFARRCGRNW